MNSLLNAVQSDIRGPTSELESNTPETLVEILKQAKKDDGDYTNLFVLSMEKFCTKANQLKGAKLSRQTEGPCGFNDIKNIRVEFDLPLIGTKKADKPTKTASTKKKQIGTY